ncbi:MAG: NtaA/DmoA family FMN-dependent monooxygenase [Pseudomonadales bacterium]|jgi:FMN-dependent oxidoreductase (nitrilotriacetate monooxygenase family)|nr:NtaA/DmoA family FMN-dependent monooxygenase [Pseudomonadales bacterium]
MSKRKDTTPHIHFTGFMLYGPAPHMINSWVYPEDQMFAGKWHETSYWTDIAQTLERGCFDMLFFADGMGGGTNSASKRFAIQFPTHDPLELVPYLAAKTDRLGFAVTMSTSFYPPYMLARKLQTLDHVTNGRIGWNIVCSLSSGEARNFGSENLPEHDERYDRADEFLDCVNQLWESWEPDAMQMDMETGQFADPDKIHKINFEGRWIKCQGPLNVAPSPQGKPYIFQAGGSERGKTFAAKHAECVFASAAGTKQMRETVDDLKSKLDDAGRDPEMLKVLWGGQPLVAATESEAREKFQAIRARIPIEAKLSLVAGHFNLNLSDINVDEAVAGWDIQGTRGMFEMYVKADPNITLRQIAESYLSGSDDSPMVGTPEQVADYFIHLIEEGGGTGFQITPAYYAPQYYRDFVEQLVPVLQRKGAMRTAYEGSTLRDYMNTW